MIHFIEVTIAINPTMSIIKNGMPMAENANAFQNGIGESSQTNNPMLKVVSNHPNNTVLSFIVLIFFGFKY